MRCGRPAVRGRPGERFIYINIGQAAGQRHREALRHTRGVYRSVTIGKPDTAWVSGERS